MHLNLSARFSQTQKRMGEESSERWSIELPWVFRDRKYTVSADVRDDVLVVQVTDGLAADRWRGQFEPKRKFTLKVYTKKINLAMALAVIVSRSVYFYSCR